MFKKINFIFFLFLFQAVISQVSNDNERLKVGVVLSGGGAKGMAHIGVLKVIEESGVKVDYIGGTSMGAIVASLYASGYSATQLDSLFRNLDFAALIQDDIPRSSKSFYEKENDERYALTLPFDKFKVSTPEAFSGGQNVYNLLARFLYHVKDVKEFDKLPIPFLCVATDAESGKEVVLKEGYLPKAVAASSALPSLFEPTIIDDTILIDGGIVNNYPIDEVRAMGADVIIGSDVQVELLPKEELSSALQILEQINNYRTANDMQSKSMKTDIYIQPDISEFSLIDFQLYSEIFESGEIAAKEQLDELKKVSRFQNIRKEKVQTVSPQDTLVINHLIINDSLENYSRGYIKGKLRFELGQKITFEKFQQGINNLSATGNFKTIKYEMINNGHGEDLLLKLKETPNRTFLKIGAHYDDLYKSAALLNMTRKNLLTRDDVSSLDLVLGDNLRYNYQYYIDKGSYWSFGVNSRFNDFEREIDLALITTNFEQPPGVSLRNINFAVSDFTNQIYVQTGFKEEFAITLGVEQKYLKYSTRTLTAQGDEINNQSARIENDRVFFEKSNYYSAFGQLKLDTYNDRYYPTKGLFFDGQVNFYAFSSDFNDNFKQFAVAKARMGMAFPILKNISLNLETEGGFKLGTSQVTSFDFALGGYGNNLINNFVPFFGYDFLALPGNSYVKAYSRFDYEFIRKNHILFAANVAIVDDDLFRTGDWFTTPNFSGYAVGYGLESFLGPVQAFYAWSPEGKSNNFFISLGYWF